jgi:hypothetical protein
MVPMSTKQTRRSISVRGDTYDRLASYASARDQSISAIVEEQLAALFEVEGVPAATLVAAKPKAADKSLASWLATEKPKRDQVRERGKAPPNPTQPVNRQQVAAGIPRSTFNIGPKVAAPKAKAKPAPMPKDYEDDPARSRPAPTQAKAVATRVMSDPWGLRS